MKNIGLLVTAFMISLNAYSMNETIRVMQNTEISAFDLGIFSIQLRMREFGSQQLKEGMSNPFGSVFYNMHDRNEIVIFARAHLTEKPTFERCESEWQYMLYLLARYWWEGDKDNQQRRVMAFLKNHFSTATKSPSEEQLENLLKATKFRLVLDHFTPDLKRTSISCSSYLDKTKMEFSNES